MVWYINGGDKRTEHQEAVDSLQGIVYRVHCDDCQANFDMDAPRYAAEFSGRGVKCAKCGKRTAFRLPGTADDNIDPATFRDEVMRLTSVPELRAASDAVSKQMKEIDKQISAANAANDRAKVLDLRKQRAPLQAKLLAIELRWDDVASGRR